MRNSKLVVARVADLCARLLNRQSQTSIYKETGFGSSMITAAVEALRARGINVELQDARGANPDHVARITQYFRTTHLSNRQIVAETGLNLTLVNKTRRRFNEGIIASGGELPRCDCGQYLHHPRMCWARWYNSLRERGIHGIASISDEHRAAIRKRLLAGDKLREVAESAKLPKRSVIYFLKTFTAEERSMRADRFVVATARRRSAKLSKAIARPQATNPRADPLYAEIAQAIPRGIDPALRDDMISEAYLEVLQGRIDRKRLREGVKKVRGKVFRAFANPWGNLSIDTAMGGDSPHSFAETIPDERALAAFEAAE